MLTAAELKSLLQANRLRLSKKLGQNYLISSSAINRIVEACDLEKTDFVVEIGAGLGALTEPLSKKASRVLAVEVDSGVFPLLSARSEPWPGVSARCQDILELPDSDLHGAVVVGAIPYHITSPILVWLSERRKHIRRAVLIVQKEVAQRLAAHPGSKAYGRLSLLAQYGWNVQLLFTVPRSSFFPQPAVDSACVQLLPRKEGPALSPEKEKFFFAVVKAAFSQRRKQLVNNLQKIEGVGTFSRSDVGQLIHRCGLDPSVRGEALSLQEFLALTQVFSNRVTR